MIGFLSRTKNVWLGPSLVAAAAISYTLHIDNLNKPNPDIKLIFRPETVDDMISNATNTGDIVLFDRKMRNRHIVPTITTVVNKMHGGDYDHCGIIIKDKYGCPFIYELNHNGAHIYPYSARVIRSKARQIIVVPILTPFDITVERREELLEKYRKSCSEIGPMSYLTRFCIGSCASFVGGVVGHSFVPFAYSPECDFVLKALKDITADSYDNIPIRTKDHTVTFKTLQDEINVYSHIDNILHVR